ncbi:conjugal transfer protein (plasmid) [Pantoea sp. SGAir0184]|nr:conjugal transfer protein TraN [Enterobacter roggenkampii]
MELIKRLLSAILICTYLSVFVYVPVSAAQDTPAPNYACGIDKNGDGSFDTEGEYATCLNRTNILTVGPTHSCPAGYTMNGSTCIRQENSPPSFSCPSGYTQNGTKCTVHYSKPASTSADPYTCSDPSHMYWGTAWSSRKYIGQAFCADTPERWTELMNKKNRCDLMNGYWPSCDPAMDRFIQNGWLVPYVNKYCEPGWTPSGEQCTQDVTQDAVMVCPPNYNYVNGSCVFVSMTPETISCPTGYSLQNNICSKTEQSIVCPLGNATCVDLTQNKPFDEGNVDGTQLVDDGKKNEEGVCLDQVLIFNGRGADCKLAGVSTAFKNCCKSEGKVYSDDAGPYTTVLQAASMVKDVYAAAQEAYLYYSVAMQATADVAVASSMAADAFVNAMMASMNPATIAIAIAVHFVMQYLMKACDQMSMETAMEADSGMCHEVGTYCKKKVPLIGCVQKAKTYCCYNSILARIIQEQGRPQLKTFNGWGSPQAPECRGFTPEEFQNLDFSKINLDEYVQTMVHAATAEIQQNVTTITQSFYDKTN